MHSTDYLNNFQVVNFNQKLKVPFFFSDSSDQNPMQILLPKATKQKVHFFFILQKQLSQQSQILLSKAIKAQQKLNQSIKNFKNSNTRQAFKKEKFNTNPKSNKSGTKRNRKNSKRNDKIQPIQISYIQSINQSSTALSSMHARKTQSKKSKP